MTYSQFIQSYIEPSLTIVTLVSAIITLWVTIISINTWKREFIGKRKMELAEEAFSTFFEIKDAIRFIRNRFSSSSEGKCRERSSTESEKESRILDRKHIVNERFESKKEVFVRFNTLKYRFISVFGKESEQIFIETNNTLYSIFDALDMLIDEYWYSDLSRVPSEEKERFKSDRKKYENLLWYRLNSKDDEIELKLAEIQKNLEKVTASCFKH